MEINYKKKGNELSINFEFNKEEFASATEDAYNKNAHKYKVQGFRQGKAPRKMIEAAYGSVFVQTAIEALFQNAYQKFLAEHGEFHPVDYANIDADFTPDGGIKITATTTVAPEATLGEYKGLTVNYDAVKIGDKEIGEYLTRMRETRAKRSAADKDYKAKNGDTVNIDFAGSVDGVLFDGGTATNYELELGSHSFIDGFEEQLVGLKIGDKKDINVNFPKEYHAENLKGKPAVFAITVNNILKKELPELNDVFAKEISEFETLAELKEDVKKRMSAQADGENKARAEQALLDAVSKGTKVDIPEVLIQNETQSRLGDFEHRLGHDGLTLDAYLGYVGLTKEGLMEQFEKQARQTLRVRYTAEEIIKKEGIKVSDAEIDAHIEELCAKNGKDAAVYKKDRSQLGFIEREMIWDKLFEFLTKNNKIVAK
ncbi:MAG: trigger factor [Christensenellaceae bacterium]|nr:trigger factor [Christensenellaceae bacterium]